MESDHCMYEYCNLKRMVNQAPLVHRSYLHDMETPQEIDGETIVWAMDCANYEETSKG